MSDKKRKRDFLKKYKVVSLFSGCGGLDLGMIGGFSYLGKYYHENPFEIVWANDINERATKTQKLNFPDIPVVCGDITKILRVDEDSQVTMLPEASLPNADVVIGGFPCQDFSLAGKRKGLTVQRGNLYKSMAKAIEMIRPKVFLAENVKGLLTWENGLAIQTIVEDFSKLGYRVEYKLFNTADYGVPQTRERVIILGIRNDMHASFDWIPPTHSDTDKALLPWVTIKDAIADLEDDETHRALPNYGYSKAKLFEGKQGNTKTKADKPAPTMRAEHHGNIEFHYALPRRLSAREAARIQSFPDDFVFVQSTSDAYRQIGNAVAPVFAWHLAQMVRDILDDVEEEQKMGTVYNKLFDDPLIVKRVKNKLPHLFQLAELESSRNGKIGMEIGSVRERILIALLMYKFGIDIVDADLPITAPEVDVYVEHTPLSIKTITTAGDGYSPIKLIWTVDHQKALEFRNSYQPSCDMMVAKICWGGVGKLLLFTKESQQKVLHLIGRERYIKIPKENTNARGVEITKEALTLLEQCEDTRCIEISFTREKMDYREIYTKWLDAWRDEY